MPWDCPAGQWGNFNVEHSQAAKSNWNSRACRRNGSTGELRLEKRCPLLTPHSNTRNIMNEFHILNATLVYARTREIQDILIPYFDQYGFWIGDRRGWRRSTFVAALTRMRDAWLPATRKTAVDGHGGTILLTSLLWKRTSPVEIPWVEVRGSITIPADVEIYAPWLNRVRGHFHTKTTESVTLPVLEQVDGDLDIFPALFHRAPQLRHVGGNVRITGFFPDALETVGGRLWHHKAGYTDAPRLRRVGGALVAKRSGLFSAPHLQEVGGDLSLYSCDHYVFVPELKTVGGSFSANCAPYLDCPKLKSVGGDLHTQSAEHFSRSCIALGGKWLGDEKAVTKWTLEDAGRSALRDPGIEI